MTFAIMMLKDASKQLTAQMRLFAGKATLHPLPQKLDDTQQTLSRPDCLGLFVGRWRRVFAAIPSAVGQLHNRSRL